MGEYQSIFTHSFMLKSARNTNPDPVQMKLRQNKKVWNKQVSTFINDVINFKKTMNGAPSKFFPEKSTIKNPIPADPASILEKLTGSFQNIAQQGNSLIEEQIEYSKNRRKPQPKAPMEMAPATQPGLGPTPPATPAPPTPDLTKQLSAVYQPKYEMVVEGSNFLSRFVARLTNPPIGFSEAAKVRRARMDLLDTCVKVYKGLNKFQAEVLKSSKESIPESNKMLHQIWNNWSLVSRGFNAYRVTMPAAVPDSGGAIQAPQELVEEKEAEKVTKRVDEAQQIEQTPENPNAPVPGDYDHEKSPDAVSQKAMSEAAIKAVMDAAKAAYSDYRRNYRKLDGDDMGGYDLTFESMVTKFLAAPGQYKPVYAKKVVEEHENMVVALNRQLGTNGTNLAGIAKQIEEREKAAKAPKVAPKPVLPAPAPAAPLPQANAQLEVVAQVFLKKWLGRAVHKLSPFDRTSNSRLQIADLAESMRKVVDQIMDALEKDMNVDELQPLVSEANRSMSMMRGLMRSLHLSHPLQKGKQNPTDMGLDRLEQLI